MAMREQMVQTLQELLEQDERLVVLLGNISAGSSIKPSSSTIRPGSTISVFSNRR